MLKTLIAFGFLTLALAAPSHAQPPSPLPFDPPPVLQSTTTLQSLVEANPQIANPNLIFPGQQLTIPGADPYVVRPGDTLSKIISGLGQEISPVPPPPVGETEPVTPPPPMAPAAMAPVHQQSVNWDAVARCESGGNSSINTGNGFSGLYQFAPGTWNAYKGPNDPAAAWQASADAQTAVAERVLNGQGPHAWPVCFRAK